VMQGGIGSADHAMVPSRRLPLRTCFGFKPGEVVSNDDPREMVASGTQVPRTESGVQKGRIKQRLRPLFLYQIAKPLNLTDTLTINSN
jgi:hypothetical protein